MGQIKEEIEQAKYGFAKLCECLRNDFHRLRHEFTVRSFLTILFGTALLGGNAYLFVVSTIRMFDADGGWGWLRFGGGLLGFLLSGLMIFLLTLHFSVEPQVGVNNKETEGVSSEKTSGRLIALILLTLLALGGGTAALGIYFRNTADYRAYPQTTATVVSLVGNSSDDGYTAVYEYTVDGKTYQTKGKLKSSGEATPRVGDTVTVRYDPLDPNDIYIGTESRFTLGLGCFLVFFGLAIPAFGLYSTKKLKAQFFIAYILLGLSACIFLLFLTATEFQGLIPFFARNYLLHLVMIFPNAGILELINGIVYIGYKKGATYEE